MGNMQMKIKPKNCDFFYTLLKCVKIFEFFLSITKKYTKIIEF